MTRPTEIPVDAVDLADFDVVVDVRPIQAGASIEGSVHAPLDGFLEDPGAAVDDQRARILTVCDVGMRSAVAVRRLHELGYLNAVSLAGGLDEWRLAGRRVTSTSGLSTAQLDRYDRQIKLPDVGTEGQRRIIDATVTVIGAGGLGSPVLSYLAAAGVGTLRVVDDDVVEVSNLQRQPLFSTADQGRRKVEAAADGIRQLNPDITVEPIDAALDRGNAPDLLAGSSAVVDATDRFAARYAINDASVAHGVPLVSGSVYRWEGQLMTVMPEGPCYRCAFPAPPGDDVALDCALTGVIGPVVGAVGSMQATEVLQILATGQSGHAGTLTVYDGRNGSTVRVAVERRVDCPACGSR